MRTVPLVAAHAALPVVPPLAPSFRDVVLLSRPSSPAGQASKSGPWVPLIRELLVAGLHPTPEGGPAKAAAIADGWQTMESRRSKRLRLKVDWFQRPSPGNLSGRCFNCLSPSHLVRDCRSKTRCFKCCGLGHRASLCPVAPVRAPAISSAPKRTMWSRLGGVVPGKAFVWSCLQHRQPPEPSQSVWSRLSPPMSGSQRQTRLIDHPATSLKVWRRKASVVSDKVIHHLHQGMAADHVVGADVATNRGLSRCRHSDKRHNPPLHQR